MVEPTKRKPRLASALLIWSESSVVAGTCLLSLPAINQRLALDEGPQIRVEAAVFGDHIERHAGVVAHRVDLQPVANDARRRQQLFQRGVAHAGDALDVEPVIRTPIFVAARQDGPPGEPGLSAFQRQQLEQRAVVVMRHAPFAVVIVAHRGIGTFGPGAARGSHRTILPLPPALSRKGRARITSAFT